MEAIAGCHPRVEVFECSQTLVILPACHHTDLGPVGAGMAAVWDHKGLAVAWEMSVILFPFKCKLGKCPWAVRR